MKRILIVAAGLLVLGTVKFPIEKSIHDAHRAAYFHGAALNLSLREEMGQGAFLAALSGFQKNLVSNRRKSVRASVGVVNTSPTPCEY